MTTAHTYSPGWICELTRMVLEDEHRGWLDVVIHHACPVIYLQTDQTHTYLYTKGTAIQPCLLCMLFDFCFAPWQIKIWLYFGSYYIVVQKSGMISHKLLWPGRNNRPKGMFWLNFLNICLGHITLYSAEMSIHSFIHSLKCIISLVLHFIYFFIIFT